MNEVSQKACQVLAPTDGPAYEQVSGASKKMLLICDHASNAVPASLGRLGLADAQLQAHIGYDIGSAGLTRLLAARLDVGAVLSCFSRLVIDPNRFLSDPTSIPEVSDHTSIPGNRALTNEMRGARIEELFIPYHQAVSDQVTALEQASDDSAPLLVFVHSFTPVFQGRQRPWHVGVVWDQDPDSAKTFMHHLREHSDWVIGDNQPYSATQPMGYSMYRHATTRQRPHLMLEVRQDLIAQASGQRVVCEQLIPALLVALESAGARARAA